MQTNNRLPKFTRRGGLAVLAATAATLAMPLTAWPAKAAVVSGPMTSVIVRGQSAACAPSLDQTLAALGGRMTRTLAILDGGAAVVPANELAALSTSPCVAAVTKDTTLAPASIGAYDPTQDTGSLYNTTLMINAQKAWSKGFTGKGVGVALIDTGVAPVQGLNGPGQVINGPDLSFASQSPALTYNDEYGHGTHMAGIIAGNDLSGQPAPTPVASSGGLLGGVVSTVSSALGGGNSQGSGSRYVGNTNAFIGVAPDSHILNMKVGDENGVVDVSQVIASIDWIVQHKNDAGLNIKVINLSYGTTSGQAYTLDPLAYAAEVAWNNGIVVVTAAGNGGNSSASLNDPAYDPFVIAVGAADTMNTNTYADDVVASFSSAGDGTRNPDLVAPGVHVESLRDPGSNIDLQYGSTATVGTRFFLGSGTSQAAAVVSGAVALYYSAHPNASPNTVKKALVKGATPLNNQPATLQGAGELNVAAAIGRDVDNSAQKFAPSSGTGTLDAARGGMYVTSNGVALTGETDIMGNAWSSSSMAQAEASTSAWNGGTFNGAAWSGAGWSGAGWSGAGWSGAAWSGAGWSGAAWSGAAWSGSTWNGAGWSGAGWSGAGWSGAGWSGAAWSGAAWSGAGWSDSSWS